MCDLNEGLKLTFSAGEGASASTPFDGLNFGVCETPFPSNSPPTPFAGASLNSRVSTKSRPCQPCRYRCVTLVAPVDRD